MSTYTFVTYIRLDPCLSLFGFSTDLNYTLRCSTMENTFRQISIFPDALLSLPLFLEARARTKSYNNIVSSGEQPQSQRVSRLLYCRATISLR